MTTEAAGAGHWDLGGDLRVARMGFGAMRLPVSTVGGPPNDHGTGLAVLRRAVELGVDHIDTAAFYFQGAVAANEMIRAALRPYPENLVIATKVGPFRGLDDPVPTAQIPASQLRGEVERNLRELGRDHLDLVYLRPGGLEPPDAEPIGERFAVLAELRELGLIRHLGLSHVSGTQLVEAREIAPVVAIQNRFDMTMPADVEMLKTCERDGIAYVPFFPLGGFGVPGTTGLPDDERIKRIATRHDATTAQVLLAGLLALSPSTLAIPGTSSLAHVEENIAAACLRLSEEDLADLGSGGEDTRPRA